MGKKLDETLNFLNSRYYIETIDGEPCICRKISDKYDIEISGLNSKSRNFKVDIYVWALKPSRHTVEYFFNIMSLEDLEKTLNNILVKYQG